MPTLTPWLQSRFAVHCPRGWRCRAEVPLVDEAASSRLGFRPRADVLLEREADGRRVWVEFEVSRADPVANHAKFATARYFEQMPAEDAFVSMTSRHITPGRAALAAGTAAMMRALGIPAFQVMLLPQLDGNTVKHLNTLPPPELDRVGPGIAPEVARVLDITDARELDSGHRIHHADNPWTVSLNVRRWNEELSQPALAARWGRRPVQYFAFDPGSGLFAPSKFCAFIPGAVFRRKVGIDGQSTEVRVGGMTLDIYALLGEGDPRFDGHVARRHLQVNLGYRLVGLADAPPGIASAFETWHSRAAAAVPLRGRPAVLFPPGLDGGTRFA
jgi:hypothetical protein